MYSSKSLGYIVQEYKFGGAHKTGWRLNGSAGAEFGWCCHHSEMTNGHSNRVWHLFVDMSGNHHMVRRAKGINIDRLYSWGDLCSTWGPCLNSWVQSRTRSDNVGSGTGGITVFQHVTNTLKYCTGYLNENTNILWEYSWMHSWILFVEK